MRRPCQSMLFGLILVMLAGVDASVTGASATDAHADEEGAPVCKTAEVNPVTGHVFCIDPLGAEVAPPPQAEPCKPDRADAAWTWAPSCAEQKGS
ncbi:MAG TPA: hypothetical protein VMW68_02215 [Methyloceanibacter sp.]|nr:hypothetical protein [Methyloceanibacter sp.]